MGGMTIPPEVHSDERARRMQQWLTGAASAVVIVGGLHVAAAMVTKVLIIVFLAIILSPIYYFLRRRGVPGALSMALAARRGEKRTLRAGITRAERNQYREQLATLGLGLEDRMTAKVGLLSGGQRQALTLLMATLKKPKLLLLDEHTAALDPRTAEKVLQLSEKIVTENKLMTLMVTHNMRDAIRYGNRLIMMNDGKIILDIAGEEKKRLTVENLMTAFSKASGEEFANDRALLS